MSDWKPDIENILEKIRELVPLDTIYENPNSSVILVKIQKNLAEPLKRNSNPFYKYNY